MSHLTPLAASSLEISVIMATRDRPSMLDRCLGAFASLDVAGISWEILVVDDGEDPRTTSILGRYKSLLPLVCLETDGGKGKNHALNLAIPEARGAVFAFVDDDVLPAVNWLGRLKRACDRWRDHDVFGGRILPNFPGDVPQYIDLEWSRIRDAFVIGDWEMVEGPCDPARVWGPNMAVRRTVFSLHRFDEDRGPRGLSYVMGGDSEFILRITATGREAIHLPDWTVEHIIRPEQFDPAWLKARAFRAGRHDAYSDLRHAPFRFLGAPAGLYLDAVWNLLLAMIHCRDQRKALKNWMWYELARGQIHQHRLMPGRRRGLEQDMSSTSQCGD